MSKWLSWPTDPDERVEFFNRNVAVGDEVIVTMEDGEEVEGEVLEPAEGLGGAYVLIRIVGEDDDHYPIERIKVAADD